LISWALLKLGYIRKAMIQLLVTFAQQVTSSFMYQEGMEQVVV
jgi:hypothetical protein